jgi:hypothetical protein
VVKHSVPDQLRDDEDQLRCRELLQHMAQLGHVDSWQQLQLPASSCRALVLEFSLMTSAEKALSMLNSGEEVQGIEVEAARLTETGLLKEIVQLNSGSGMSTLSKFQITSCLQRGAHHF